MSRELKLFLSNARLDLLDDFKWQTIRQS